MVPQYIHPICETGTPVIGLIPNPLSASIGPTAHRGIYITDPSYNFIYPQPKLPEAERFLSVTTDNQLYWNAP
jgi:hypothetical protein